MNSLTRLKKQGFRLTKPRQELLKVLANYPLTAFEIYDKLVKKNVRVDLASVYRSLDLFVGMQIVREVALGGDKKRYEKVDTHKHHHHLVCTNCKTIEDISVDENNFLRTINNKSDFKIDHHHLEFFGLCKNCQ